MAYAIKVQHYGESAQVMGTPHRRKYEAEHELLKQVEILKGYNLVHWARADGSHHMLNEDGISRTIFWICRQ